VGVQRLCCKTDAGCERIDIREQHLWKMKLALLDVFLSSKRDTEGSQPFQDLLLLTMMRGFVIEVQSSSPLNSKLCFLPHLSVHLALANFGMRCGCEYICL
jgi:hypothetical protein